MFSEQFVSQVRLKTEAIPDSGEVTWQMFRKDALHTARATECQPYLVEDVRAADGSVSPVTLSLTNRLKVT